LGELDDGLDRPLLARCGHRALRSPAAAQL